MVQEKIQQAIEILKEKKIDMWMTFVRESTTIPDPIIDVSVGTHCTWQTAYIITAKGETIAIAGSLDIANLKTHGNYKEIIGYVQSIKNTLLEVLDRINPKTIALNYSTNTVISDGLTHGMWLQLMTYLENTPFKERIISAEPIISALRGRKSSSELKLMKDAIKETLKIFDKVTKFIKPGKTEQDVANFILQEVKKLGVEPAWDKEHCPAVFTGPESAGAHAGPTKRKIEGGHIINIDFGIKWKGYCSDLQRTWYIKRKGEKTPPKEVVRGFNTIIEAILLASKKLKPGVQGCDVDDAARNHITSNGYAEYPHGLGHQIGRVAHDGGGGLFPRWERYGTLPFQQVEEGQVYTLEPRLTVEGHGVATVEEMVVVTKDGCVFLSKPQKKIYLV
ncbi:MAG: Xaa-Pro peptidase family protein [Bacteroidota bacterium]|nr:Xaa-Pro peptidase family protein [Bacteroidota bacterium]